MFRLDHPQKTPLFSYYPPLGTHTLGIVSIPHSGETIPNEFETYLSGDESAYREDVDFKVNELIDIQALQKAGVAVLVANVHRICVDLNRAEDICVLCWKENTHGKKLVVRDPGPTEIEDFIETYHRPYYEVLKSFLQEMEKKKAGLVSMIDLHSMPSRPTAYHMKQNPNQKMTRPDFCLSDRKGKTCLPEYIQFFQSQLEQKGHTASLNDPYVGGFVTEYVDRFRNNNIQIEINRQVYMDEDKKALIDLKAQALKPLLTEVLISGFEKFNS